LKNLFFNQTLFKNPVMKNIVIVFALLFSNLIFAQLQKDLGDFDRLKVSDRIEVRLIQSDKNAIEISGEKSEEVKLITRNDQLIIRMETTQLLQGEDVMILLFYKDLKEIIADRGAIIYSEDILKKNKLKIEASKGSEINLSIESEHLEVKVNSGAEIALKGQAGQQEVISNSGGNYDGEELETLFTKVTVNAGGQADIFATKNVEAKTRAGGSIHIWGGAEVEQKKVVGGNIRIH